MRGVERVGDLGAECEQHGNFQRLVGDALVEGLADQVLHHDERLAVVAADFVNGADIGMVQSRGSARLAAQAGQCGRVSGDFVGQELQSHKAAQGGVFGLVDNAHSAAA